MTAKKLPSLQASEEETLQIIDLMNNNFQALEAFLKDHYDKAHENNLQLGSIAQSLKEIVKHLPKEQV